MYASDMFYNGGIKFIPSQTDSVCHNHAAQRYDGYLCCSAADIDYHMSGRLENRDISPDGSGQ